MSDVTGVNGDGKRNENRTYCIVLGVLKRGLRAGRERRTLLRDRCSDQQPKRDKVANEF